MTIYDALLLLPLGISIGVLYKELFSTKTDLFETVNKPTVLGTINR